MTEQKPTFEEAIADLPERYRPSPANIRAMKIEAERMEHAASVRRAYLERNKA